MKLLSFFTKPIQLKSLEDLEKFVEHYRQFHVHPTNFISANGIPMHTEMNDEPLDGNCIFGNPLEFDVNEDDLTVVIRGEGGFSLAQVRENHGYLQMSPVVGDLLADVFDERFYTEHPDFEIYTTEEDSVTGEESYNTIVLADIYSQEAMKSRFEKLDQELRILRHKIKHLQQQEEKKEKELKEIEAKLVKDDADIEDQLPF